MTQKINRFREEYFFLSNMYPAPLEFGGMQWKSSEHAYQAHKTCSIPVMENIQNAKDGYEAKRLGRQIKPLRSDWADIRVELMYNIVSAKFNQNKDLSDMLLTTGDIEIVEGNTWNDTFWGVDINTGMGKNNLGNILMRVRRELRFYGI